jgi:hypothetical protein
MKTLACAPGHALGRGFRSASGPAAPGVLE